MPAPPRHPLPRLAVPRRDRPDLAAPHLDHPDLAAAHINRPELTGPHLDRPRLAGPPAAATGTAVGAAPGTAAGAALHELNADGPAAAAPGTAAGAVLRALDAGGWAGAALAGPLVLADGSGPAVQATQVRLAWDAAALYVRFDCRDRDAWGTYRRRNDPLYLEEAVEVFLAPGTAAPRRYAEIEVSPHGTVFAARISNPTGRRADLLADTTWECAGLAVQVGAAGAGDDWWAALAIPWLALLDGCAAPPPTSSAESTPRRSAASPPDLAPGAPARLWRANFYRIERPRGGAAEFSCWSPTLTTPPDFHRPQRFGRLVLAPPQPRPATPAAAAIGAGAALRPRRGRSRSGPARRPRT